VLGTALVCGRAPAPGATGRALGDAVADGLGLGGAVLDGAALEGVVGTEVTVASGWAVRGGWLGAGPALQPASSTAPTTADASGIRRDNLMPSPAAFQFPFPSRAETTPPHDYSAS